jgi:thiol:disulfide interchange protein
MRTLALIAALTLSACGKAGGRGGYDATRDPAADIKNALAQSRAAHKRVLIEAGGNWCSWCKIMDRYFEDHAELAALRDKNYVTVRVNIESGGPVPGALKAYPAPNGYPHIYILDENGSLIQSQNTAELESGQSYDLEKFTFFLNAFAPRKP